MGNGLALFAAALILGGAAGPAEPIAARARRLPAASSLVEIGELSGRWRVTGVAVVPGPVQAFLPNDPAYLGREVVIARESLRWRDAARAGGASLDDRCEGAATVRLPRRAATAAASANRAPLKALGIVAPVAVGNGHEVACLQSGHWGPEAAGGAVLFAPSLQKIAFTWYDGVVLRLERVAR